MPEQNTQKAWPIREAHKIIQRFGKENVLFETGYGPSGLPHIGTFSEVVRTNMVRQTYAYLTGKTCPLLCFSDDMDGLRKVPANVPNQAMLLKHIKKPLARIPDPFGCHDSYADHNIQKLETFLKKIPDLSYKSLRASHMYSSGKFDSAATVFLQHYHEIMNIILPSLGEERQKTYSIFLPISPISGRVLEVPILDIDVEKKSVLFKDEDGREHEQLVIGGGCKLQWRADFALRWYALGINYEMCGKDVGPSFDVASAILQLLGKQPPVGMIYELFLDRDGHRISKSSGNEQVSVDLWTRYAPQESLSHYVYQSPRRAKRLDLSVVPHCVDSYLKDLKTLYEEDEEMRWENAAFYVHNLKVPPKENIPVSFTLLLNLISVLGNHEELLWSYLRRFAPSVRKTPLLKTMVAGALRYEEDLVSPTRHYIAPSEALRPYVEEVLDNLREGMDETAIQTLLYVTGKKTELSLKKWFQFLYRLLFGKDVGPRLGSFIHLYGIPESKELLRRALARPLEEVVPPS